LWTLPVLLLGGIIENQNSGFVIRFDLYANEVRILIFDDPAEQEDWQRPESGPREGKLSNQGGRPVRARCMNFVIF
jgi:hypothetical protein